MRTNTARNSRTDYQVDRQTYEQGIKEFEAAFLRTSPDEAADAIVAGIRKNSPRVLIGKDAKKIDFLARLRPGSDDRVIARRQKRGS